MNIYIYNKKKPIMWSGYPCWGLSLHHHLRSVHLTLENNWNVSFECIDDQHVQGVLKRRRPALGRHQFGGGQIRRRSLPLREAHRRTDTQHRGHHEPHEEHPDPQRGRSPATILFGASIRTPILIFYHFAFAVHFPFIGFQLESNLN